MIAAREIDDLEIFDLESTNHRVIDSQQPGALGRGPPGPLDRAPFPLRRLDRAVREEACHPSIDRPDRGRIEIADDQARVARVLGKETFESGNLTVTHQWGGKRA